MVLSSLPLTDGPLVIQHEDRLHCTQRLLCCRYQLSITKGRTSCFRSKPPLFEKVNVGGHLKEKFVSSKVLNKAQTA
jgi:hypothetical protein